MMGRSITPKYSLTVGFASGRRLVGPMPWTVRDDGPATDAGLAAWIARFNASMAPGGANAHLGPDSIVGGKIRRNVIGGDVVASWSPFVRCVDPDCGLSRTLGLPITPHSHPGGIS